jgi:hypothetical protein
LLCIRTGCFNRSKNKPNVTKRVRCSCTCFRALRFLRLNASSPSLHHSWKLVITGRPSQKYGVVSILYLIARNDFCKKENGLNRSIGNKKVASQTMKHFKVVMPLSSVYWVVVWSPVWFYIKTIIAAVFYKDMVLTSNELRQLFVNQYK